MFDVKRMIHKNYLRDYSFSEFRLKEINKNSIAEIMKNYRKSCDYDEIIENVYRKYNTIYVSL